MLLAEYDYDTDIAVQRQESLRIGLQRRYKTRDSAVKKTTEDRNI